MSFLAFRWAEPTESNMCRAGYVRGSGPITPSTTDLRATCIRLMGFDPSTVLFRPMMKIWPHHSPFRTIVVGLHATTPYDFQPYKRLHHSAYASSRRLGSWRFAHNDDNGRNRTFLFPLVLQLFRMSGADHLQLQRTSTFSGGRKHPCRARGTTCRRHTQMLSVGKNKIPILEFLHTTRRSFLLIDNGGLGNQLTFPSRRKITRFDYKTDSFNPLTNTESS